MKIERVFPNDGSDVNQGMSLRDYFAGQALAGWCADPDVSCSDDAIQDAAKIFYKFADAMLAAREPTP